MEAAAYTANILNAVKTKYPQLLTNPKVQALVKHHEALNKAIANLKRGVACEVVLKELADFVKLTQPATVTTIVKKFNDNMIGVLEVAGPALKRDDAKAVLALQTDYQKAVERDLVKYCAGRRSSPRRSYMAKAVRRPRKFIQTAIRRPGALRKYFGLTKRTQKINPKKLNALIKRLQALEKKGKLTKAQLRLLRQAVLARTLRRLPRRVGPRKARRTVRKARRTVRKARRTVRRARRM